MCQRWRDNNRERARNTGRRHDYKKLGLTLDDYARILADQEGVCAICRRPERRKNRGEVIRLAVDHCHSTGKVRGLLCCSCNRKVGWLENGWWIKATREYLARY